VNDLRYDVAVLKLNRPIQYTPHIVPICLPQKKENIPVGTEAKVSGWGITDLIFTKNPRYLQVVDVEIIQSEQCEDWRRNFQMQWTIYDDMLCAGYEGGVKDSCRGDSGGPLMTQGDDGRWSLMGVVSSGLSCSLPKLPGIYHKVSESADWITFIARFLKD